MIGSMVAVRASGEEHGDYGKQFIKESSKFDGCGVLERLTERRADLQ